MTGLGRQLLALASAAVLAACNAGNPPPDDNQGDYVSQVQAARRALDETFRKQPNQPVPPDKMNVFLPLKYFPPNPAYIVPAELRPAESRIVVEMPTSTGKIRQQQRVGVLEFTLDGRPLTLGAFVEAGANLNRLFVPFSDMTSGTDTYAAGRYLELNRTPTGIYNIDFNKAYNPYCYYNPEFDCPYPPKENRLPLPILAGERVQ
jgi:uncharacterized protein (DUF1684 family)